MKAGPEDFEELFNLYVRANVEPDISPSEATRRQEEFARRLEQIRIIAVQTHDPDGNPYEGSPEDRAREAFNLTLGRGVDDPVNLTKIEEEDLPKEKLEQVLLRHDEAVYLVKNE